MMILKKFAGEVDPEQLYQMIDILNEQQENMRFTLFMKRSI